MVLNCCATELAHGHFLEAGLRDPGSAGSKNDPLRESIPCSWLSSGGSQLASGVNAASPGLGCECANLYFKSPRPCRLARPFLSVAGPAAVPKERAEMSAERLDTESCLPPLGGVEEMGRVAARPGSPPVLWGQPTFLARLPRSVLAKKEPEPWPPN